MPDIVLAFGVFDALNRHGFSGVCFFLTGNPATFSMRRHTHYYVSLGERLGGPAPG